MGMAKPDFEDLEVYKLAEELATTIWHIVRQWDNFARDTLGKQIVRAADSVCTNIAEGRGRHNFKDNQRFVKIARGSLYETVSWLRLARSRQLITDQQTATLKPIVNKLLPKLSAYFNSLNR